MHFDCFEYESNGMAYLNPPRLAGTFKTGGKIYLHAHCRILFPFRRAIAVYGCHSSVDPSANF